MIIFFVCLGMTTEIFFTAFMALFTGKPVNNKPLVALAGTTYVWMAFIYGLIPIIAHYLYEKVKTQPFYNRIGLYVILIYTVEFISGYILKVTTGSCPWEYKTGWHIMGLIRLDFLPAWCFFAWMVERLYVFINNRVIQ
ncbi:MAG: hypothetical protein KIS94_12540 [Chitinophagales bacterium]|nr:hypothetical protein [Chitinophagales bacterium]